MLSPLCRPSFSATKRGMSLVVVLSVMVLSTVVGTSLYRTLSKQASASGAQLHRQTAQASAQAGLSATRAWLTYHGIEVRAKIHEFLNAKTANGGSSVPFELDVSARYPSNERGQQYKAYLVDVMEDRSTPNTPFSVKVQILGLGQDGSEAVLSAVLELGGVLWQERDNSTTPPPSSATGEDALFVGGSIGTLNSPLNVEGSLYINSNFQTNSSGPLRVTGDLVFGPGANESYFNAELTVERDLYVGGEFYTNNATAQVLGNAYFNSDIQYIQSPLIIDGSAHFNGNIGTAGNMMGNLLHVKSHATFYGNATVRDGSAHLRIDGDAGFFGRGASIVTNNAGRITVAGNAQNWGTFDIAQADRANFGTTAANWVDRRIALGQPLTGPATINTDGDTLNWDPSHLLTLGRANTLDSIRNKLSEGGGTTKPEPFAVQLDTIDKYKKTWGQLGALMPGCGASTTDFEGTKLQCFHDNAPDSIKTQDYLVADIQGLNWNMANTTPLDGKFIVLVNNSNNGRFPPSLPSSRVLIYQTGGSINFGIQDGGDCYCVFYAAAGGTMTLTGSGRIIGATLYGSGTSLNINSGTGLTFIYNESVLGDVAVTGAIANTDGTPLDIPPTPPTSWEIALLSPRLHVLTKGEYPQSDLIDTSNVEKPGPGVVLTPGFIEVDSGATITASRAFFEQNYGVVPRVVFADPANCNPAVVGSPSVNTTTLYAVTRVEYTPNCGEANERSGYLVLRVKGPSELASGEGAITFRTAGILREYDSGPLLIPVDLEVNGILSAASTVNITVTPLPTNLSSYNVVLPLASTLNFDVGQGSSNSITTLQIDLQNNPLGVDRPEGMVILRLNPVVGGKVKKGSVTEYVVQIRENRFTTYSISATLDTTRGLLLYTPVHDSISGGGQKLWHKGRQVVVKAIPLGGYEFDSWGGACAGNTGDQCSLNMDGNKNITAVFTPRNYTLTILSSAGGQVNTSPTCPDNVCTRQYGQTVQLTAVANLLPLPHSFSKWQGTGALHGSTVNPLTWNATADDTVQAVFRSLVKNCFYDDFNSGTISSEWVKEGTGPDFGISSGRLIRNQGNETSLLIRNVDVENDGIAEAQVNFRDQWSKSVDGIVLRFQDPQNYYFIGYIKDWGPPQNHIYFCSVIAGVQTCQESGGGLTDYDGMIHLSAEVAGSTFTVRVNNDIYATFTDATFASGRVGIRAGSSWDTKSEWDDFRWTEASGCGAGSPPEIANCRITNSSGTDLTNPNDTLTVLQGRSLRTRASATDPDANPMNYTITTTDGTSYGPFAVEASTIDYSAIRSAVGSYALTLVVEDTTGLSASCVRKFKVVPPASNQPPVITTATAQVGGVDFVDGTAAPVTVSFFVEALDPDGDPLTFTWSGAVTPKTETVMSSTHSHTFTNGGTYDVLVSVDDGKGGTTLHTFTLQITGTNSNPIIDSVTATPSAGTKPLTVSYRVYARDPDGNPMTYEWGGSITGTASSINKTYDTEGSYSATITVRDNFGGVASASAPIVSVSSAVNEAPTFSLCTADPAVGQAPQSVSFTANASDPNGDPLTYTWGAPVNKVGQTVSADFNAAFSGSVSVTVSDGRGGSATCNAPVAIAAPNVDPVITACEALSQNAYAPMTVNFSATATDGNNDALTYTWTGTGTGNVGVVNQQNHSFIFTLAGTYAVTLLVEDGKGGSATCDKSIIVAANTPPTVASCETQYGPILVNDTVLITAVATDSDMPLTYRFRDLTSSAFGAVISENKQWMSYSAIGTKSPGVSVKDAAGDSTIRNCGTFEAYALPTGTGTLTWERWNDFTGTMDQLSAATGPSATGTITSLTSLTNVGDNYGQRVRGYIHPPRTGPYVFWINGDDGVQLRLSANDQPSSNVIASHNGYTGVVEWDKYATQKSSPITLTAGNKYYFEVLHKDGWGGDHFSVGWAKPGQPTEEPSQVIPGAYLEPYTPEPTFACNAGNSTPWTASSAATEGSCWHYSKPGGTLRIGFWNTASSMSTQIDCGGSIISSTIEKGGHTEVPCTVSGDVYVHVQSITGGTVNDMQFASW